MTRMDIVKPFPDSIEVVFSASLYQTVVVGGLGYLLHGVQGTLSRTRRVIESRLSPEAAGTIAEISAAKFSMMLRLSIATAEKEHGFSVQKCKSVLAMCSMIRAAGSLQHG